MYPIFHPSVHIHIPMYLVATSLAFTVAIIYFYKRAIRANLPPKVSSEISIVTMLGVFFGARLFHILFEYPEYYIARPLEIIKFYNGGFVFYGGLFGGFLAAFLYIKKIRQNFLNWLDCAAPVLPIGYAIGRIGCLFAGCCYGAKTNVPWAIQFSEGVEAPAHVPLHPTQIYAVVSAVIIWIIVVSIEKYAIRKDIRLPSGILFFMWLFLHSLTRLIIEQFRGDYRGDSIFGLSISSVISLVLIAISAAFLKSLSKKTPNTQSLS